MPQRFASLLLALCLTITSAAAGAGISADEANELLGRWLRAQNEGDFAAYRALYAKKFLGIKRSGPRVYRFEAEGWLKDRERMFRKKMLVTAKQPLVAVVAGAAVVDFEQTWSSGGYSDTGRKRLVLALEAGQARISREEMLESRLLAAPDAPKPLPLEQFAFVLDAGREAGGPWLVLSDEVEEGWAEPSSLAWVGKGSPMAVRAEFRAGTLPENFGGWRGRSVAVYGAEARLCEAKVGEVGILARVEPHFGMRQAWTGQGLGEGEPIPTPPPDAEVARELWELGGAGRLVVGRLEGGSAECFGAALWARAADRPEPVVYRPSLDTQEQPLQRQTLELFQRLAGYADIQKQYDELKQEPGFELEDRAASWDQTGSSRRFVDAFFEPGSGRGLAYATGWISLGCAFDRQMWAVWEVAGGRHSLLTDERGMTPFFQPLAVFDADGDGQPEALGKDALLSMVGPSLGFRQILNLPNFDCGC